ncbi:hypothetical protein VITFI_CDS2281 [Vitreoscilla filiformis]|uniref:Uncharacterized protein n=1 Tax=Vitreoscilla filiformis TaxID=63 RepID=A0A221KGJ9_VITFI|nr:hypothetical protein VITFI_CDS2281 [Vitreoscilla filiformis]
MQTLAIKSVVMDQPLGAARGAQAICATSDVTYAKHIAWGAHPCS